MSERCFKLTICLTDSSRAGLSSFKRRKGAGLYSHKLCSWNTCGPHNECDPAQFYTSATGSWHTCNTRCSLLMRKWQWDIDNFPSLCLSCIICTQRGSCRRISNSNHNPCIEVILNFSGFFLRKIWRVHDDMMNHITDAANKTRFLSGCTDWSGKHIQRLGKCCQMTSQI